MARLRSAVPTRARPRPSGGVAPRSFDCEGVGWLSLEPVAQVCALFAIEDGEGGAGNIDAGEAVIVAEGLVEAIGDGLKFSFEGIGEVGETVGDLRQ